MRVIINHLTRMKNPAICIAGIDPVTNNHVRPQLRYRKFDTSMLSINGGKISLGSFLDLGNVVPIPSPPELEDHQFQERNLQIIKKLTPKEFWTLLKVNSQQDLLSLFGSDLLMHKTGAVVEEGKGIKSLGCLWLADSPMIALDWKKKPRLLFKDRGFNLNLSITDIRFYNADFSQINYDAVKQARNYIRQGNQVIISVGLTRLFRPSNGAPPFYHWLQVNNIHFESNPLWLSSDQVAC